MQPDIKRRRTRAVYIGRVKVGGNAPVSVQSMTKTDTADIPATVRQIKELEELGCEVIRLAIPNHPAAQAISQIKKRIRIPIEADIHFNPKLALESIKQGVDSVRLNPGNITDAGAIADIARKACRAGIPIRVGLNSGSVKGWFKSALRAEIARGKSVPNSDWQAISESALEYAKYLQSLHFNDIMISLKCSDVVTTVRAYRDVAGKCDYPLHLGVTASGTIDDAAVKSAIGIGGLLLDGIGDTLRVSVTGLPHDEVKIGYKILQSLGLRRTGLEIISCPTCGRCEMDIVRITERVRQLVQNTPSLKIKEGRVAIMGCVVNGPGEAEECDVGIAGGKGFGFLFKKGKRIRKIPESKIASELIKEIKTL
ncbi:MAG: flavodoxin-dependent (E)-4-hydroxy-3-methylbut-2-enyl-diphosphate synthase [Planctomycetota bacterium]